MIILTLNCGSSSAKYQVFDWDKREAICVGLVERIGEDVSHIENESKDKEVYDAQEYFPTHKEAVEFILKIITDETYGCIQSRDDIKAVGHRIVHGGETFTKSVVVTDAVLKDIEDNIPLAPLHNPGHLMGIKATMDVLPKVPNVTVMDTAWHQTMPEKAFRYAVPKQWYTDHKVRKYGFHGTSFLYTTKRAAALLGKDPKDVNLIIAHVGNGASMCAVKNGVCYDTTMGLTPLDGLVMGSRSGTLDPAVIRYMAHKESMTVDEVDTALNKKSGLLGVTGKYIDRRDVLKGALEGDKDCILANDMECYRIKKYIGSFVAALGRVDAVIFTAGVGEMARHVRKGALEGLEVMGIKMDERRNELSFTQRAETIISADDSPTKIFVIPTDEELVMAEDTVALLNGNYDVHTNFEYSFQKPDYVNKSRAIALEKQLIDRPELKEVIVTPKM
ncbi:acetate kinase [Thiospirochaeta perfilievii]|uniref:Acetate kinase n=1 Tax=Thiospirochaeta perfilievii TaxID=252967 RepID=A0A5C1QDD1_9SPIO|nr:acetate kinase [Thiospirochaeta perfilievii]QEN05571.1 acetate kinase [Thiospirochaeta perfilievii]